jgi:outer membrane protein OmpA-like peptidoglycan-associated protein
MSAAVVAHRGPEVRVGLRILLALAVVVALGLGCATRDPSSVERAREALASTRDSDLVGPDSLDFREAERHLAEAEELLEDRAPQDWIDHEADLAELYSQIAIARTEAIAARLESEAYMNQARASTLSTRVAVEAAIQNARSVDARQTGRGLVLTLGGVLFGIDSDRLTQEARLSVARVAGFLIALADRDALIEGHTDSSGAASHNLDLSRRRAESVRDALAEFGVEKERLMAEGYGSLFPVADNSTAAGRERNRRVEIVILRPGLSASDARR